MRPACRVSEMEHEHERRWQKESGVERGRDELSWNRGRRKEEDEGEQNWMNLRVISMPVT